MSIYVKVEGTGQGHEWSCLVPSLSGMCLKLFPLHFFFFPLYLSSLAKKQPPDAFLSQGRDASQMLITKSQRFSDRQSSVKPQGVVRVEHLSFTNRKACTQQVKILLRIFSPAITRPGVSLLCIMKQNPKEREKIDLCRSKLP